MERNETTLMTRTWLFAILEGIGISISVPPFLLAVALFAFVYDMILEFFKDRR